MSTLQDQQIQHEATKDPSNLKPINLNDLAEARAAAWLADPENQEELANYRKKKVQKK